jgi:hypothetical protein
MEKGRSDGGKSQSFKQGEKCERKTRREQGRHWVFIVVVIVFRPFSLEAPFFIVIMQKKNRTEE